MFTHEHEKPFYETFLNEKEISHGECLFPKLQNGACPPLAEAPIELVSALMRICIDSCGV